MFKDYNGHVLNTQFLTHSQNAITPEIPSREGHTFTGWRGEYENVTADLVIHAEYAVNTYTVTFETDNGVSIEPLNDIEHGTTIELPIPIRAGYGFKGWYTGPTANDAHFTSLSKVTAGMTLFARWDSGMFTVRFVDLDDHVLKEVRVATGESPTAPRVPHLTGYAFTGWTEPFDNVTKDILTKTMYSINQYTITFDSNNGSFVDAVTQDYATPVIEPEVPIRKGYTFSGWYADEALISNHVFTTMPAEDMTLYAGWEPITYAITYSLDGGTHGDNPATYTITTATITLAAATKEGHSFGGWYASDDLSGSPVTEIPTGTTGPLSLYAKWSVNQYTLTYATYDDYHTYSAIPLYPEETISFVSLRFSSSYALTSIGRLFTWGDNCYGQLGDGTARDSHTPSDITPQFNLKPGETIVSLSPGSYHTAALTSEGRLFTWGWNEHGQLGDGTTTNSHTPTDITPQFNLGPEEALVTVSLIGAHATALTSTGRLFTWGYNYGQLGDGTTIDRHTPTDITPHAILRPGETILSVSMLYHALALTSDGRILTWGLNEHGQLGDGTTYDRYTPGDITPIFNLGPGETILSASIGYYHSAARTSAGRLFTWGRNAEGQLGDGTTTDRATPGEINTQFGLAPEETILSVSLGWYQSSARTTDGRLFTWGSNSRGQLGDGTTTDRLSPIDITAQFHLDPEETFVFFSITGYHAFTLTSAGRLFTWGSNDAGQLGDGTNTDRPTPTDITTQFNLNSEETLAAVASTGLYHTLALTTDGRLFTWGLNDAGQLGDGSQISKHTPNPLPFVPVTSTERFTIDYGVAIDAYLLDLEGHTFDGWYIDMTLTAPYHFTTMPGEDIILYGRWTINAYEIWFESNGGSLVGPIIQDYGTVVVAPAEPIKEGYTFGGWYRDADLTTAYLFTTMPAENITLYALWIVDE